MPESFQNEVDLILMLLLSEWFRFWPDSVAKAILGNFCDQISDGGQIDKKDKSEGKAGFVHLEYKKICLLIVSIFYIKLDDVYTIFYY